MTNRHHPKLSRRVLAGTVLACLAAASHAQSVPDAVPRDPMGEAARPRGNGLCYRDLRGSSDANPVAPNGPGRVFGPHPGGPSLTPTGPPIPSPFGLPSTATGDGVVDTSDWSTWWRFNRHEFLRLKDRVWSAGPSSGDAAFHIGAGQRAAAPVSLRPSDDARRAQVAPALKRTLAEERNPTLIANALLALARLGELPVEEGELTSAAWIRAFLPVGNQEVRATAALALGMLGDLEQLDELAALCASSQRGAELVGEREVDTATRTFAAYGMGLLARHVQREEVQRYVAHQLVQCLEAPGRGGRDLPVACVNALALLQLPAADGDAESFAAAPPASSRGALVMYLLGLLEDRRLDERVRAHVPRALAAHLDPYDDPLKELVAAALVERSSRARRAQRELQYGAIQALGAIGTAGSRPVDVRIRAALRSSAANGNQNARHLSLVALAELGARPHHGSPSPLEGTEPIRAYLIETLARGRDRTRPWAALALGVHGYCAREADLPLSSSASEALRRLFAETRRPSEAGVYALALGLRGDHRAAELLRERLGDFRVAQTQGHVALALGMLRATDASGDLRDLIAASSKRPELLAPVATGLALLGDKSLVPALADRMLGAKSGHERSANALALAGSGDMRALEPTIALLTDPASPPDARQTAAAALGWMCELDPLPWNACIARRMNYLAAPPSLTAELGGGVCDLP